ncbi:hypothetical protein GGR54DRAFT_348930 [Hypoxylon sp. NC1633]|nr:hypothetical protein GGR54DRAFT_348930 [Hypoxylon sp. NC1633]
MPSVYQANRRWPIICLWFFPHTRSHMPSNLSQNGPTYIMRGIRPGICNQYRSGAPSSIRILRRGHIGVLTFVGMSLHRDRTDRPAPSTLISIPNQCYPRYMSLLFSSCILSNGLPLWFLFRGHTDPPATTRALT